MKKSTLISKLEKNGTRYTELNGNGYNKDIEFTINGKNFLAGFIEGIDEITDFCREICYDKNNQEMQRRYFDNFNQVIKYANR